MTLPKRTASNYAEALFNVRKIENNLIAREFQFLNRDRHKIRAHFDRHKEAFLQLTRQRHETWYRHDHHFREGLRKEKANYEKRRQRQWQQAFLSSEHAPYEPVGDDGLTLPAVSTPAQAKADVQTAPEPMTKVERHTYQVLRASQKLLDESAARPRYTFSFERPRPSSNTAANPPSNALPKLPAVGLSASNDEYDRLVSASLQHGTFGEFVDHFVKFRPEYCEQFNLVHEEDKRQQTIDNLRRRNQVHARTRDDRYHNLLASLTDPRAKPPRDEFDD